MSKPDTILDEIHEIRRQIYEEIKDMTPEEIREFYRKDTEPIIKEYGMKVASRKEERVPKARSSEASTSQ